MSNQQEEHYHPDDEEIQDAVVFMKNCSDKDLLKSWNGISSEWDLNSVITVHRFLCGSGRISILVQAFTSEESKDG